MKRILILFVVLLVFTGCARVNEKAATTEESEQPESAVENVEVSPDQAVDSSDEKIDAQQLLAKTLETAKTEDKRVLIHLGSPG